MQKHDGKIIVISGRVIDAFYSCLAMIYLLILQGLIFAVITACLLECALFANWNFANDDTDSQALLLVSIVIIAMVILNKLHDRLQRFAEKEALSFFDFEPHQRASQH